MGNYRCAIFDLDGTLLDSTWVWEKIDIDFLAKRGIAVPADYMQEIRNHNFITGSKYVIERFHLNENVYRFKLSLSINISIIDKMIRV